MSHHYSELRPSELDALFAKADQTETDNALRQLRREQESLGLGATGNFPRGKLTDTDEGEIKIGIVADPSRGVVLVDFGKPVRSIGFTYDEAMALADSFRDKAFELRGITK